MSNSIITTSQVSEIVRNEFNFEVRRYPLSGPDGIATPHCGLFRVFDGDSGPELRDCIGMACSDGYVPHQSDDVIALAEAAGEAFEGEFKLTCHWRDGHHLLMEPTRDYRKSIFGTADNIFPRFIVSAGYDGRAFKAILGTYRDACQNMARIRTVEETVASIRHTRSLRSRMSDLIEIFQNLKSSWGSVCDVIAQMQSREMILSDFLAKLYPADNIDSKRGATIHKERTEAIFRRIMSERFKTGRPAFVAGQDVKVSGWEAYNGVQGYIQHGSNRRGNQNNEFARILLALDNPIVGKAEQLALSM